MQIQGRLNKDRVSLYACLVEQLKCSRYVGVSSVELMATTQGFRRKLEFKPNFSVEHRKPGHFDMLANNVTLAVSRGVRQVR